jgi:hypothetical protein
MQSGGSPYFQKKAAALEREIASAEQEAGGNAEELELNFKRVRHVQQLLSWHPLHSYGCTVCMAGFAHPLWFGFGQVQMWQPETTWHRQQAILQDEASRQMLCTRTGANALDATAQSSHTAMTALAVLLHPQAQHEYECNDAPVRNMSTVVKVCVKAVTERWQKYDELFADVSRTVSAKFQNYMHRRGHAVSTCLGLCTAACSYFCHC